MIRAFKMYAIFENNADMINKTHAFLRKHVYDKKESPLTKYYCVRSKLTGFFKNSYVPL